MEKKPYKYCFVPSCKSTSIKNPEKLFFTVPRKEPERSHWLKIVRRDSKTSNSNFNCCEDHFNKTDFENYEYVQIFKQKGIKANLRIKKGSFPSKFDCQTSRLLTRKKTIKSIVEKLERNKNIQDLISLDVDNKDNIQIQAIPSEESHSFEMQPTCEDRSTEVQPTIKNKLPVPSPPHGIESDEISTSSSVFTVSLIDKSSSESSVQSFTVQSINAQNPTNLN